MSIWRYAEGFSSVPPESRICLGEGNTPVVRSRRIGPAAGLRNLYFKLDTCNPSGSYKDRFAAVAVSHLFAAGKRRCIATSSGNTGAALAAYCAAAGIACEIVVVENAPAGKLLQMRAYGAQLWRIRGFGADPAITSEALKLIEQIGAAPDSAFQISAFKYCPAGMSGVRTVSYELADQIELPIDHVFCPAGAGGLVLATAQGFEKLVKSGRLERSPAVECVQPEGNDTIAGPLRDGASQARQVQCTTLISGLQVSTVIDGNETLLACRASGGTGHVVTDEHVWRIQTRLAREEGIFCEPAGATSVAGALQAAAASELDPEARIVCVISGSGFKDPVSLERMAEGGAVPLQEVSALEKRLAAN